MIRTSPVREARAETLYWLEEMQRLLREPVRDSLWQEKWLAVHQRWQTAHDRWMWISEHRN